MPNARATRVDNLARTLNISLTKGNLKRATQALAQLSAIAQDDYSSASDEGRPLYLRIADLAISLAEAKSAAQDTAGAVADYGLAADLLHDLAQADDPEAVKRSIFCAEYLCILFRYRLKADQVRSNFHNVLERNEGISPEQSKRMAKSLAAGVPDDPEQEVYWWHRWNAAGIAAFERAASIYQQLSHRDFASDDSLAGEKRQRCTELAAKIRSELATKLIDETDTDTLRRAEKAAQSAYDGYALLSPECTPTKLDALELLGMFNWKLQHWEKVRETAKSALQCDETGLDQRARLAKLLAFSCQKTHREAQAVAGLEDLVARCRRAAAEDIRPIQPLLVDSLLHLGIAQSLANDPETALRTFEAAVGMARQLAAQNGEAHGPLLASVASVYAELCDSMGRAAQASNLKDEAARWENRQSRVS
jgi:hypothetical protein